MCRLIALLIVEAFIRKPCRCLQGMVAVVLCFIYHPCAPRSDACRSTKLAQNRELCETADEQNITWCALLGLEKVPSST